MKKRLLNFKLYINKVLKRKLLPDEMFQLHLNYINNNLFYLEDIKNEHADIINTATYYLKQIRDPKHDISHTQDVLNNVEKLLPFILVHSNVDIVACYISAYWHDVGRLFSDKEHEFVSAYMLKNYLEKLNYSESFISKCYLAVIHHRWNMQPTTIEGNILRDADKLAFIGEGRWSSCLKSDINLDDIINLLPKVKNEILYFDASKELFDKDIFKFINMLYSKLFKDKV